MDSIRISSDSISKMRLPMAVMVVIIHHEIVWRSPVSSWNSIYDFIVNLIGGGICQVAVPTFFLISGWLFFSRLHDWDWNTLKNKLKKRFWSLLLPYLIWNIFKAIAASFFETKSFNLISNFNYIVSVGLKEILWSPIDFPLWFVRDLMICVIISPLLWYGIKKGKHWFVLTILVMYVFSIPPFHEHLSGVAVPLFVLGGWVQIFKNGGTIIKIDNTILIPIWILLLLSRVLTTGVDGLEYVSTMLLRLMKLSSVLVAFSVADTINNDKVSSKLKDMGQCSFWLFAAHTVVLRDISFMIAWKVLPMDNAYIATIAYFMTIIMTLILCFATYYGAKKIMPKTVSILCGR